MGKGVSASFSLLVPVAHALYRFLIHLDIRKRKFHSRSDSSVDERRRLVELALAPVGGMAGKRSAVRGRHGARVGGGVLNVVGHLWCRKVVLVRRVK
jgi:hypothetical protein